MSLIGFQTSCDVTSHNIKLLCKRFKLRFKVKTEKRPLCSKIIENNHVLSKCKYINLHFEVLTAERSNKKHNTNLSGG